MLISLTVAARAQAQPTVVLKWAEVDKPSINGEIIVTPSEVNRIAASHDVVYAVDTANSRVHRSNNGGLTFTDITSTLSNPAHEIAVAPDRPQYVAVSDNISRVYWSNDSGATWNNTGLPAFTDNTTIQCIAISNGYRVGADLFHDLAVGTAAWGDNTANGQIWTLKVGASFSGWQNQALTFPGHPGAEVSAIAFSPQYNSDSTILAVASDNLTTALCIGQRDLFLQITSWNNPAGYPLLIDPAGDAPGVSRIISTIALPSDYSGALPTSRKVFVSYNRQPDAADDVYRFDDVIKDRLRVAGGASDNISSIAYYGTLISGKLLAGESNPASLNTVQVRRTLNPLGTPIGTLNTTVWNIASQPPSGPGNAQVAWSYQGTVAFCGTGQIPGAALDESAFSQSYDNGDTWAQTSLINTNIHISDIAPAPDSRSLFMATYSDFGPEGVWRSAGEPLGTYWGRLWTMNTASDKVILRLSPDYSTDYTIYAAEASDDQTMVSCQMVVSENRGNSWHKRFIPGPVIDIVAASTDTLYLAQPVGYIRKSTDGGLTWGGRVLTGLYDINMLAVTGNGHLLVGSRDSKVAYSTDNGTSFTEIIQAIGNIYNDAGDVQVVADANYSSNNIIYASDNITGKGIWRWVIGHSMEWEQIDETITDLDMGQHISSLVTGDEGTLYALRPDNVTGAGAGGMTRSLNPYQPYTPQIEFDIVNATLPTGTTFDPLLVFPDTLPHLKLSDGAARNELWAVGTADNNTAIYRFIDNLCKVGPATNGPDQVGCDPVAGRSQEVNLAWEQLSLSDQYEIQIAKDNQFTTRVLATDNITPADVTAPAVYFPAGGLVPVTTPKQSSEIANWGNLECGHTYFLRVRTRQAATGEIIRSPWSEVQPFTIKAGLPVRVDYYGLKLLSPDNGCIGCPVKPASFSWSPFKETTKYKFALAKDAAMTQVIVQAQMPTTAFEYNGTLNYSTNYFWRIMAIEPSPSDWSATFSFQTEAASPQPTTTEEAPPTPLWVWVVIIIGAILTIVTLVLIFKTS